MQRHLITERKDMPDGSFELYPHYRHSIYVVFDPGEKCIIVRNGSQDGGKYWEHIHRIEADQLKAIRFELDKNRTAEEMRVYAVKADEEIYLFSIGRVWATASLIGEIEAMVGRWGAILTGDVKKRSDTRN